MIDLPTVLERLLTRTTILRYLYENEAGTLGSWWIRLAGSSEQLFRLRREPFTAMPDHAGQQ
jgi:hypothetical protein